MNDTTITDNSASDTLDAMLAAESLPIPPIPSEWSSAMKKIGDHVYGTRDIETELYAVEAYVSELKAGGIGDYLLAGFDGHGMASWALHYYLVKDRVAFFFQLVWGDPYNDAEIMHGRIESSFELAKMIMDDMEAADKAGKLPPDQRLVVIESDFGRSRWGWAPMGSFLEESVQWDETFPVIFNASMKVKDRLEA